MKNRKPYKTGARSENGRPDRERSEGSRSDREERGHGREERSRGREERTGQREGRNRGRGETVQRDERGRSRNEQAGQRSERGRGRDERTGYRDERGRGRDEREPRERRYLIDYNDGLILEGRNAVLEALNHDKPIDKIYVKKGPSEGSITVIIAKAREKGIVISEVAKEKLDHMSQSGNHQGVIAACPAHDYAEVADILKIAADKGEDAFIIILDSVTDPHNLGAIMRSADCSGVHGIIIPKRRSASLTGIVSKTSAGAIEHVPVARISNLNNAVDELKEAGLWICCAKTRGRPCFKADMKGPIAIIIGSEGEGVSKLLEKKSDFSVSIPMYGEIASLNASVAAGLLMYEVVRQRKFV